MPDQPRSITPTCRQYIRCDWRLHHPLFLVIGTKNRGWWSPMWWCLVYISPYMTITRSSHFGTWSPILHFSQNSLSFIFHFFFLNFCFQFMTDRIQFLPFFICALVFYYYFSLHFCFFSITLTSVLLTYLAYITLRLKRCMRRRSLTNVNNDKELLQIITAWQRILLQCTMHDGSIAAHIALGSSTSNLSWTAILQGIIQRSVSIPRDLWNHIIISFDHNGA